MSVEFSGIRAVLTDIEGTTSSISFVKDVLFPYARKHLPTFVAEHRDDPEVCRWLSATATDAGIDDPESPRVVAALLGWIDADVKATPLKALQGMIWKAGYESGAYRAHMYPEVPARLRAWKAQSLKLYVFSSGSVPAQQLFFEHSEAGDLAPLIDGWFDTETGGKRDEASYTRIAAAIGLPSSAIVFLSDIAAELDAAKAAGMPTVQLCRPPESCTDTGKHPCAADFQAIHLA
jgi:enolase-phosphatase E1